MNSLEGYPSGWRGRFAKSLVWGNLEREFESPTLRQEYKNDYACIVYFYTLLQEEGRFELEFVIERSEIIISHPLHKKKAPNLRYNAAWRTFNTSIILLSPK